MRICSLFPICSHNVQHLSVYNSFAVLFIIAEAKLSRKLLCYTVLAWSFDKIWADNLGDLPLLFGLEGTSTKLSLG